MLAALDGDRFKLFAEAEIAALDIPYDLRRSTQNEALKARALKPWNDKHMPIMSGRANRYLETLVTARRESNRSNNYRIKYFKQVRAFVEAESARGPFDRPASGPGAAKHQLWHWHGRYIENWHRTCKANWAAMTAVERLWFGHKPEITRSALDFPLEAPGPYRFYPLEETPERERQRQLLIWVIADEDARLGS